MVLTVQPPLPHTLVSPCSFYNAETSASSWEMPAEFKAMLGGAPPAVEAQVCTPSPPFHVGRTTFLEVVCILHPRTRTHRTAVM